MNTINIFTVTKANCFVTNGITISIIQAYLVICSVKSIILLLHFSSLKRIAFINIIFGASKKNTIKKFIIFIRPYSNYQTSLMIFCATYTPEAEACDSECVTPEPSPIMYKPGI